MITIDDSQANNKSIYENREVNYKNNNPQDS